MMQGWLRAEMPQAMLVMPIESLTDWAFEWISECSYTWLVSRYEISELLAKQLNFSLLPQIYKCDNEKCPRPDCYRSCSSSKEDVFRCDRPKCKGFFRLLRWVTVRGDVFHPSPSWIRLAGHVHATRQHAVCGESLAASLVQGTFSHHLQCWWVVVREHVPPRYMCTGYVSDHLQWKWVVLAHVNQDVPGCLGEWY